MRLCILAVVGILCLGLPLVAQGAPDPMCVNAEKVLIPKGDLPPAGAVPPDCDPLELSSLPGRTIDLRETRYCAFAARDAKSTEKTDMTQRNIAGNGGLAMIYAGGKGVAPNLPLAVRFACEIQDWEGDGRDVGRMLDEKLKHGATRVEFDICEHPTGRKMNDLCIQRDQNRAKIRVDEAEKRLDSEDTPAQRAAFERVRTARKAYFEAHEAEEATGNTGLVQGAMREAVDTDEA
jgi:hypothetical protein